MVTEPRFSGPKLSVLSTKLSVLSTKLSVLPLLLLLLISTADLKPSLTAYPRGEKIM